MSAERRGAIARLLAAHDLVCIEDVVYGSSASAFTVGPAAPPNGVRFALGSPPLARLGTGLQILRSLALNGDEAHVE
jgi:DNA-binding transcriptional MocR family regulator